MPETNSVVHSTRRALTGFEQRTASGSYKLGKLRGKIAKQLSRDGRPVIFPLYRDIYLEMCTVRNSPVSLFINFFSLFPGAHRNYYMICPISIADSYRETARIRVNESSSMLRNEVRTYPVAEYYSCASRESQSARRHTLNTIPGALLNAARAFISYRNGWMNTKEPGRFAEVSVMKPDQNNSGSRGERI